MLTEFTDLGHCLDWRVCTCLVILSGNSLQLTRCQRRIPLVVVWSVVMITGCIIVEMSSVEDYQSSH